MKDFIAGFFRPRNVITIPPGVTPDLQGGNAIFGLMANVNAYAETLSSVGTVAGNNVTLIPAQLLSGVVQLNSGVTGAFNITLPSTGAIIAGLPSTIPFDGSYSERWTFINQTAQVGNLTAGDGGTSIQGATVIGSSFSRTYIMRVLGSANITVTNIGQLPL